MQEEGTSPSTRCVEGPGRALQTPDRRLAPAQSMEQGDESEDEVEGGNGMAGTGEEGGGQQPA